MSSRLVRSRLHDLLARQRSGRRALGVSATPVKESVVSSDTLLNDQTPPPSSGPRSRSLLKFGAIAAFTAALGSTAYASYVPLKAVELYLDLRRTIEDQVRGFTEPLSEKLLPDLHPQEQHVFTLVLDLNETLVYSDWKRDRGWRTFKRPGVDAFLEHLAKFYEIVVYSDQLSMYVDPVLERLDQKGCIRFRLSRAATKYVNGKHFRDLSKLNRDPSRILYISGHALESSLQPENCVPIKPWKLENDDTALLDLIPFLEYVALHSPTDIRSVLASYEGRDIASEFIERSKEHQRHRNVAVVSHKSRFKSDGLTPGKRSRFLNEPTYIPVTQNLHVEDARTEAASWFLEALKLTMLLHQLSSAVALLLGMDVALHPTVPLLEDNKSSTNILPLLFAASAIEMHETEQHDLSDDSDYAAASRHHAPGGIMRTDSGKSTASEAGGSEVLYLKDNVAIHPTQYASERISGRLRLYKQGSSLFLSWIPYKPSTDGAVDSLGHGSSSIPVEKDRNLYTIKSLPISDVHSIRRHTPALSWPYIIVVLSSGLAYPPFYFYNGGVREFLATLKQHVFIVRSADDSNVFLVNDFQDPLQRTLSSLELPRVVSVANRASRHKSDLSSSSLDDSERLNGASYDATASTSEYSARQKKSHDPARDISIHVLEKFSLVTKFARETTSHLFRESHNDGLNAYEKKQQTDYGSLKPISTSDDKQKDSNVIPVASDPLEFEKLPLVWGKQRMHPLCLEEWASFLDSEGRILDSKALRERIFYGGVDHNIRKEVWKFLLGYHEYDSTYAEREYLASVKKSEYEVIKSQWQSISSVQAKRFTKFRERKGLIDKDVVRTDRSVAYYEGDDNPNVTILRDILLTYSFYNFDLGYCQLVELLDSPLHNYFKQADCLNYFFCFRWILIQFKREFEYDQVMHLWEVLWTHYLSEHLHLYMCVAILKSHRKKIMGEQMDFDTLLKFINELSGNIDLDWTIREAEALCICAGENGAASIPPGTPPSLPIEPDMGLYPQEDEVL
ncbi:TBC1 domain family member [Musa troglodytarum]|uniref:TBC1 domain family member n=1 Tax=Musa troglodytarum TaxID=320322 RepID=A0A9E7I843_9LILI|nr:TBC1 domain family member [Musa troglodytarum]